MKVHSDLGGMGLLLLNLIAVQAHAAATPIFTDITESAGVGIADMLTESVAWGDYDNDDDEDLYLPTTEETDYFGMKGMAHLAT